MNELKIINPLIYMIFLAMVSVLVGVIPTIALGGPSHQQTIDAVQRFNADQPQSSPKQEVERTVYHYQSISNAIQADQQANVVPSMGIYNMSIFTHIKAIAKTIGEETNKLVELIMPGKPQTVESQKQVNVIMNNIDNERKSLTNYISVQQPSAPEKFDTSKYDRPKDKKFKVHGPQ